MLITYSKYFGHVIYELGDELAPVVRDNANFELIIINGAETRKEEVKLSHNLSP